MRRMAEIKNTDKLDKKQMFLFISMTYTLHFFSFLLFLFLIFSFGLCKNFTTCDLHAVKE